jgi:hypothetical protein
LSNEGILNQENYQLPEEIISKTSKISKFFKVKLESNGKLQVDKKEKPVEVKFSFNFYFFVQLIVRIQHQMGMLMVSVT